MSLHPHAFVHTLYHPVAPFHTSEKICYNSKVLRKPVRYFIQIKTMRHLNRTLSILLLISMFLLASCGNKKTDAAPPEADTNAPQKTDILTESQQTRQELEGNMAAANSLLASVSSDEVPVDSTEIIRHATGDAPSTYKPTGQMVTKKYRRFTDKSYTYVSTEPDTITTRNSETVMNVNP